MTYNFRYEIAAVIISITVLISFFKKKTINTRMIKSFEHLIILVLVSSLLDCLAVLCLYHSDAVPTWVQYLTNIIYQLSINTIPINFYYCFYFVNDNNGFHTRPKKTILSIPYLYILLLIITTPFTKLFFYFENGIYHRGLLFFTQYIPAVFYVALSVFYYFKIRKKLSFIQSLTIVFYLLLSLIAVFIQVMFPSYLVMGFCFAISTMLAFIVLNNPRQYEDSETGLLNRRAFITEFSQALKLRQPKKLLVIQFEGTEVIKHTIGRINKAKFFKNICLYFLRLFNKLNVFRISDNKLVVILSNDNIVRTGQINAIKSRFLEPFFYNDVELTIPVILNLIFCPEDACTIEETIDLIDNVKNGILNHDTKEITRVDTTFLEKRRKDHLILQYMKNSLSEKDIEVVYQPILTLEDSKCHCAEALIRLKTSQLGFIEPEVFIPLAEKNGMIQKIGNYVFNSVCKFLSENNLADKGIHHIHINLSVIQCMQENLYSQLFSIMDDYHLNYELINFEITEESVLTAENTLKNNMNIMYAHHLSFALDDYGLGTSNISNLLDYPFEIIKIDQSLIWKAMKDKKAESILKQTISLIKDLNIRVLAEGIETAAQAKKVQEMGVEYIQGYHYSYPLPEKDFLTFLN
ncbi:MAG: EAL domain-containing protein [Treponema sp.]|nr:EAL domain-containing protein [Treponema sp.]